MGLDTMKVRTKLLVNAVCLIGLLLVVGTAGFVGANAILQQIYMNEQATDLVNEMAAREQDHLDWVIDVMVGLSTETILETEVEEDHHKCGLGAWYYGDKRERAEEYMPEIAEPLRKLEEPHIHLHRSIISIKKTLEEGGTYDDAQRILETETLPSLTSVREQLDTVSGHAGQAEEEGIHTIIDISSTLRILIIVISIIAIIVGILLGVLIVRSILRQLGAEPDEVNGILQKIADGDFTVDVHVEERDTTSLLYYMRVMKDDLENLVGSIMAAADNLVSAVDQIAMGNQNLSQRTSEQASALEEIASTIEETTATVNQNADNSTKANQMSENSASLAENGGELVNDAVVTINEINETSAKIGEIITVINDIAFQTNLLALNAAVEAARAGEQGRGFAVVAGEVRNLAQRSGNAAKEIGDLIKESLSKITLGTDKANKSGEALQEIIKSISGVSKMINEIAAASLEQKQGMNQINIAVTEMDTMTQQNAALVEETASASEEMANQAQELMGMMQRFKINTADVNIHKPAAVQYHGESSGPKRAPVSVKKTETSKKIDSGPGKNQTHDLKDAMEADGFEEF